MAHHRRLRPRHALGHHLLHQHRIQELMALFGKPPAQSMQDMDGEFAAGLRLASPSAAAAVMTHLEQLNWRIDFLVNNAGLSGHSKFAASPWAPLGGEIQLMMTTLTELTHSIAPGMIERRWGRIINVSSLAALSPPGESLLYSAIKTYVLVLSQSLDMEFKPHGMHVTAL